MAATAWCPVDRVTGSYGISNAEVVRLIRMNWRMVVLEIISSHDSQITYSEIAGKSGLSSRTLAIVLKELTSERLVDKHGGRGNGGYSITIVGKRIATMPCPLLRFASDRKRK